MIHRFFRKLLRQIESFCKQYVFYEFSSQDFSWTFDLFLINSSRYLVFGVYFCVLGLFGPRSPAVRSGPRPPPPIQVSTSSTSSYLVQSLWSCAHYFQWFTGYLNHVDLLMLHVATRFKEIALLFNVHLCFFADFILCLTDKYMFKVGN